MTSYNPPVGFYSQVSVPSFVNIPKLIGKNGANFKWITRKSGVSYIWHDRSRRVIEVWSSFRRNIPIALDILHQRIASHANDPLIDTYWTADGYFTYELRGSRNAVLTYLNTRIKATWYDAFVEEAFDLPDGSMWMRVSRKQT